MKNALIALLLLMPAAAQATPEYILPTLFDVTGVARNDVLNIRAKPSARSAIVGSLRPDATRIEIVGVDRSGRWGQVNTAAGTGWVAMRYLAYRVDVWNSGALPAGLTCTGTEPFWALTPESGTARWETPEGARVFPGLRVTDRGDFRNPARILSAADGQGSLSAEIAPEQCSDKMSDRVYGLSVSLRITGGMDAGSYSGCCLIAPPVDVPMR